MTELSNEALEAAAVRAEEWDTETRCSDEFVEGGNPEWFSEQILGDDFGEDREICLTKG